MKMPEFFGDCLCLIESPRAERTAIHFDKSHNIRLGRFNEITDLLQIFVSPLQIAAVGKRQVEAPSDACPVSNIIK
jgi:hypothetical protein